MGCHVFLVVHHVNCYDIFFVLLPFSKPNEVVGAYVRRYFFCMAIIFEFVRSD